MYSRCSNSAFSMTICVNLANLFNPSVPQFLCKKQLVTIFHVVVLVSEFKGQLCEMTRTMILTKEKLLQLVVTLERVRKKNANKSGCLY